MPAARRRCTSAARPASPCSCQRPCSPAREAMVSASECCSAWMFCASQADSGVGPCWRRGSVSRSSRALTMAFSGSARASMRRPPGARRLTISSSAMAASSSAFSQRPSRFSKSASIGARSRVSPSTSTPRLASQLPMPGSTPSFQRCTGSTWCAKPGSMTTCQSSACNLGTVSAMKSGHWPSSGRLHRSSLPTAASGARHCIARVGRGRSAVAHSVSRAKASAASSRCAGGGQGRVYSTEVGAGVAQGSPAVRA